MSGILLFRQKSGIRHLIQNLLSLGSIPAANSQNFVDTLGPQKPTWVKLLKFEIISSERQIYRYYQEKN